MMGERTVMQEALFYGFSLERHVPYDHLLRRVDRFVDLYDIREHSRPYYRKDGQASDPSRTGPEERGRRWPSAEHIRN